MKVNRQEFLNTLARVAPGLSTRDFIEQSACYIFNGGWASSFNDEVCCRTKTGLPDSVVGAVRAKPLVKALENLPDEEVDISVKGAKFDIQGHRRGAWVRLQAEIVLPVDSVEPPAEWRPLAPEFPAAIRTVVGAAGRNDEEFLTVCVHVHPEWVEACDRWQAARFQVDTGVSAPYLVRAASIAPVSDLGLTKVGETESWVHFRSKYVIYSCRRHIEVYPHEKITEMMRVKGTRLSLPSGVDAAAKLGGGFTEDDKENDKVTVRLTPGKMFVEGVGAHGGGWTDLELPDYSGSEMSFRIAPKMLAEIVERHTVCEVSPGKLKASGEGWCWMSVLGRVSDTTPDSISDDDGEE